jgi:hypothetical protein
MYFSSQVCTDESQSKRLLNLGISSETADCYIRPNENGKYSSWVGKPSLPDDIPAWSLHRLMELCPLLVNPPRYLSVTPHRTSYNLFYDDVYISFGGKLTYDNLIDCIKWLIDENHFNNKYLNE